jgi:hypothetical protein
LYISENCRNETCFTATLRGILQASKISSATAVDKPRNDETRTFRRGLSLSACIFSCKSILIKKQHKDAA